MGQGNIAWRVIAPCADGFGQAVLCAGSEMPALGMAANQQDERKVGQRVKQSCPPGFSAFAPWRKIVAAFVVAGETKGNRGDRDPPGVIKAGAVDSHPVPQTVTRAVVEGNPCFMHTQPRGLTDHAKLRRGAHLQHRSGTMGQMRRTDPAGSDVVQERREFRHAFQKAFCLIQGKTCIVSPAPRVSSEIVTESESLYGLVAFGSDAQFDVPTQSIVQQGIRLFRQCYLHASSRNFVGKACPSAPRRSGVH